MDLMSFLSAAAGHLPTSVGGVIGYGLLYLFGACLLSGADAGGMSKTFSWQFRLAAAVRTPVLVFVVVPMSFVYNVYRKIRTILRARRRLSIDSEQAWKYHDERVQRVVDQVDAWDRAGRKQKMRTARPNWSSMSTKLGSNKGDAHRIDVSHLDHILEIDEANLTITCEPGVNMGDITNVLLPRMLALLCQVEMEALTIGGLSVGLGMETNSHVIGWFQETIVQFEIVTGESPPRVLKVTRESDPDLFYSLPHSVGTLGFLTSVKVQLARTKPFVRMKYIMTKSAQELCNTMTKLGEGIDEKTPQFLEATAYSKDTAVIQCGEMCDAPRAGDRKLINRVNLWYKPFYFKHLQHLLEEGHDTYEEIIPLKHYYHRFTRSIFWEIEYMIPFSNHPLYRFFWGWLGAPEVSLLKLFQGPVIRQNSVYAHVVQESCMPVRRLAEGLSKFEQWWDIYPLLIFPLRTYDRAEQSGFLNPRGKNLASGNGNNWGIWVDLAAYGVPKAVREGGTFDAKRIVRECHHWTESIGGWTIYYTDLFCTRKEYRRMFDHTLWEKCRVRFNANDAFPEPFDKVRPEPGIVDLSAEETAEETAEQPPKQ